MIGYPANSTRLLDKSVARDSWGLNKINWAILVCYWILFGLPEFTCEKVWSSSGGDGIEHVTLALPKSKGEKAVIPIDNKVVGFQ